MRSIVILAFLAFGFCAGTFAPAQSYPRAHGQVVSRNVRSTARRLVQAWVDTASAQTLDQLASRSIAFAGMVPGVFVMLGGRKASAAQALSDSALTILGPHTTAEDAEATRIIVNTLTQITDGRIARR